jgi:predicted RNase H-like HicB family nuclease/predicted RNA binding protein YcfA (HicA-like mRNA interferase family)
MEARHLLKKLKDDGWYLGDTAGACRQYVHKERQEITTVHVRYTDELGPATLASALEPGAPLAEEDHQVVLEATASGFSAFSPDLPGCIATADTEAEARHRLGEAMTLHLSGLRSR